MGALYTKLIMLTINPKLFQNKTFLLKKSNQSSMLFSSSQCCLPHFTVKGLESTVLCSCYSYLATFHSNSTTKTLLNQHKSGSPITSLQFSFHYLIFNLLLFSITKVFLKTNCGGESQSVQEYIRLEYMLQVSLFDSSAPPNQDIHCQQFAAHALNFSLIFIQYLFFLQNHTILTILHVSPLII